MHSISNSIIQNNSFSFQCTGLLTPKESAPAKDITFAQNPENKDKRLLNVVLREYKLRANERICMDIDKPLVQIRLFGRKFFTTTFGEMRILIVVNDKKKYLPNITINEDGNHKSYFTISKCCVFFTKFSLQDVRFDGVTIV